MGCLGGSFIRMLLTRDIKILEKQAFVLCWGTLLTEFPQQGDMSAALSNLLISRDQFDPHFGFPLYSKYRFAIDLIPDSFKHLYSPDS
jgi:hypothetical protein